MKTSRYILWLTFVLLSMSNCRTYKVLPDETEINKVNLQVYFNVGDNVTVHTTDGDKYRFNIKAFEETKLSGANIKIPYTLIDDIKVYQDMSLALVGIGLAILVAIVALGASVGIF